MIVQLLLQAGVPVNCSDFKGLTPLMTACMFGKVATAAYLLGMGAFHHLMDINGDTAMHWAAHKGHADIIPLLVNAGADMQQRDNFGSTPLHLACLSGSSECVSFFRYKASSSGSKDCVAALMMAVSEQRGFASEGQEQQHAHLLGRTPWTQAHCQVFDV